MRGVIPKGARSSWRKGWWKRQSLGRDAIMLMSRNCRTEMMCSAASSLCCDTIATSVSLQIGSNRSPLTGRAPTMSRASIFPSGSRVSCCSVVSSVTSSSKSGYRAASMRITAGRRTNWPTGPQATRRRNRVCKPLRHSCAASTVSMMLWAYFRNTNPASVNRTCWRSRSNSLTPNASSSELI